MNWFYLLFAIFLTLTPVAVRAQMAVPHNGARSHFQKGLALADAGRFEEAVVEFESAYALKPQPAVLFNVAIAYANARRPAQASSYLRKYLASAGPNADPRRVRDAEARLVTLETIVGGLEVVTNPAEARLLLDGQPVTSPLVIDPGAHLLTATAPGYEPSLHSLQISQGEHRSLQVVLTPMPMRVALAEPMGLVMIRCNVPDVRIIVDDASMAMTPRQDPISVKAGARRIRFERQGYQSWSVSVEARAAALTVIDCKLRPEQPLPASSSSLLRVRRMATDVLVVLDEEPFSGSGRVPSGRHTLRVERPGYAPWSTTLQLEPERTANVTPSLAPTKLTLRTMDRERSKRNWVVATTAGAGLVLSGVTTWLVVDNRSRYANWQREQRALDAQWRSATIQSMPTTGQHANDDRADRIKLQDEIAVGTGVASGALLIAAAALFFTGRPDLPITASVSPARSTASLLLPWE
jgi:hypothetical protein